MTPAPPTSICPVAQAKKSSAKVKTPPPQLEEPLVDDDNIIFVVGIQDDNNNRSNDSIKGSDLETKVPSPANKGHSSTPTQNPITTVHTACCWILHSDLNFSLPDPCLTLLMPTSHTLLEHPFRRSKLNPPVLCSPKLTVYQERRASEPTQLDGRRS